MIKSLRFATIVSALIGVIVFFILSIPVFLSDLLPKNTQIILLVFGALLGGICAKLISRIVQLYKQTEKGLSLKLLLVRGLKIFLSIVIISWLFGTLLGALISPITIIGLGNFSTQIEPLTFTLMIGFLFAILGAVLGIALGFFWLISQP